MNAISVVFPIFSEKKFEYLFLKNEIIDVSIIGCRVLAPFKKLRLVGIIVSFSLERKDNCRKLRRIYSLIDKNSIYTTNFLSFLNWISKYYFQPFGYTLFYFLPKLLKKNGFLQRDLFFQWKITKKGKKIDLNIFSYNKKLLNFLVVLKKKNIFSCELIKFKISSSSLKKLKNDGLCTFSLISRKESTWLNMNKFKFLTKKIKEKKIFLNFGIYRKFFSVYLLNSIQIVFLKDIFFIRLFNLILNKGSQILILVPNKVYVYIYFSYIKSFFDFPIDYIHSKSSNRKHVLLWNKINNSEIAILVGTSRSLFMPFSCLGLILVVEEHDLSYKRSGSISFNIRNLAILRAKIENISIILQSNTPSLESLYNLKIGKYKKLNINFFSEDKKLKIVKKNSINLNRGCFYEIFSYELIEYIKYSLEKNNSIILIFNESIQFFFKLVCKKCNWEARCLICCCLYVFDFQKNILFCRSCLFSISKPSVCLSCSSVFFKIKRYGFNDLIKLVKEIFLKNNKKYFFKILNKDFYLEFKKLNFNYNYSYIFISNKKENLSIFSNIQKRIIIFSSIDDIFYFYSYRIFEYFSQFYFQMINLFSKCTKIIEFFFQTIFTKDNYLINLMKHNTYYSFSKYLFFFRKKMKLPPFTNHAIISVVNEDLNYCIDFFSFLKTIIFEKCIISSESLWIYGPIFNFKNFIFKYNSHILVLQTSTRRSTYKFLKKLIIIIKKNRYFKKIKWKIDLDPVDF
ncbi:Primosomal protein N' [Buchnera aphidicola (Tetraneura ulmi)]|uniref:primosomal protein N' family DNA-binding protein n=1 Tax=Buchnera aphidicola TaxID=9 RepID=UPI003463AF44